MPGSNDSSPNFDFLESDNSEDASGWSPTTDSALGMIDSPKPADDDETGSDSVLDEPQPSASVEDRDEPSETVDLTRKKLTLPVTEPEISPPDAAVGESPVVDEPVVGESESTDIAAEQVASDEREVDGVAGQFSPPVEDDEPPSFEPPASESTPVGGGDGIAPVGLGAASTPTAATSAGRTSGSRRKKSKKATDDNGLTISGTMAVALVSYALTMTLLTIYLVMSREAHQLESLPDRAPIGPEEFRFVPESAAVPPRHRLQLGDSIQFGHIRVEPIKITKGTASLVHYSGSSTSPAPPSGEPILKLWLRLTNVSDDQKIAPFDRQLVYDRRIGDNFEVLSDQFVVPADKLGAADPNVPLYDLPPQGEWDLIGQRLDELKPGESMTTFLAAGPEEMEQLTGAAVWRILMRKGYHEATGHGVLTLFEVEFNAASATQES